MDQIFFTNGKYHDKTDFFPKNQCKITISLMFIVTGGGYPAIKCECTFLNLYYSTRNSCIMLSDISFDREFTAILINATYDTKIH